MALPSTNLIKDRLRAIARRERQVVALAGVAKVLIALALFSAVFFLVDWLFLLSAVARAILMCGGVGAAAWIAKTELRDPLRRRRDEITTALKIEARFPALRDRLISVVQLSDGSQGVSQELLQRLEVETAQMTATLNFSEVINWLFFRKILLVTGAVFGVGVISAIAFPQYASATFRRMLFGDVRYPSLTQIELCEGRLRLTQGEDWTVTVALKGRIPSSVSLKMRNQAPVAGAADTAAGSRKWITLPLKPILGYTYGVTFEKVQQSFEFQIFAGDAWTPPQLVRVLIPVAVLDPVLDVEPPPYSGLQPVKGVPLVGTTVIEGSKVTVRIPTTKPLARGVLLTAGGETLKLLPLPDGSGASGTFRTVWYGDHTAPTSGVLMARNETARFEVQVTDTEGLENPEPRVLYSLQVQKDQLPKVRLLSPKSDRISVPYANWKITYEATDDFGVRKAWLAWEAHATELEGERSEADSEAAPTAAPRPLHSGRVELPAGADPLRWPGETTLDMVAARAVPGETLVVWVEAADARSAVSSNAAPSQAWVGVSPPVRFVIVDENAKWEEIQKRLDAIEEGVVHLQDSQKSVKKEVESLRK